MDLLDIFEYGEVLRQWLAVDRDFRLGDALQVERHAHAERRLRAPETIHIHLKSP